MDTGGGVLHTDNPPKRGTRTRSWGDFWGVGFDRYSAQVSPWLSDPTNGDKLSVLSVTCSSDTDRPNTCGTPCPRLPSEGFLDLPKSYFFGSFDATDQYNLSYTICLLHVRSYFVTFSFLVIVTILRLRPRFYDLCLIELITLTPGVLNF